MKSDYNLAYSTMEGLLKMTTAEIMAVVVATRPRTYKRSACSTNKTRKPVPRAANGRCICGACHACQDNARWERIFNEKFASPDYYISRALENWSTLAKK